MRMAMTPKPPRELNREQLGQIYKEVGESEYTAVNISHKNDLKVHADKHGMTVEGIIHQAIYCYLNREARDEAGEQRRQLFTMVPRKIG